VLRNAFWLVLIGGASAAIGAGFVQASLTTHPPPLAQLRVAPRSEARVRPAPPFAGDADRTAQDAFAQDDVVVARVRTVQEQWQRAKVAAFVAECGTSVAAIAGFLRLGVPVAFVVDPAARNAETVASVVRDAGQSLFVQAQRAPDAAAIADLRRQLGPFDGVAGRNDAGMAAALQATGLAYFDERGNADPRSFQRYGVPLVRRDVTADDRSREAYVAFMLERAAALSRRAGTVVVLLRPLPSSASALRDFLAAHDVQMVDFR